jgi:hypothetical protein
MSIKRAALFLAPGRKRRLANVPQAIAIDRASISLVEISSAIKRLCTIRKYMRKAVGNYIDIEIDIYQCRNSSNR